MTMCTGSCDRATGTDPKTPEASSLAVVVSRTVTIPLDLCFLSVQLFSFQVVMYSLKHCQLTSSPWCSHSPQGSCNSLRDCYLISSSGSSTIGISGGGLTLCRTGASILLEVECELPMFILFNFSTLLCVFVLELSLNVQYIYNAWHPELPTWPLFKARTSLVLLAFGGSSLMTVASCPGLSWQFLLWSVEQLTLSGQNPPSDLSPSVTRLTCVSATSRCVWVSFDSCSFISCNKRDICYTLSALKPDRPPHD